MKNTSFLSEGGIGVCEKADSSRVLPICASESARAGRSLLKGRRRAAEKALGCYGGDVSRLLDLCRARIVLPSPRAAAECARAVAEDAAAAAARAGRDGDGACAGVRVLRVRNGVAAAVAALGVAGAAGCFDDSSWGGGFRVRP